MDFRYLTIIIILYVSEVQPKPLRQLDSSTELTFETWPLVHSDKSGFPDESRKISPKSIFQLPSFSPENLPPCADGYKSDAMGRCVYESAKLDPDRHFEFLVEKLINAFPNGDEDYGDEDGYAEEPLHISIPFGMDMEHQQQNETIEITAFQNPYNIPIEIKKPNISVFIKDFTVQDSKNGSQIDSEILKITFDLPKPIVNEKRTSIKQNTTIDQELMLSDSHQIYNTSNTTEMIENSTTELPISSNISKSPSESQTYANKVVKDNITIEEPKLSVQIPNNKTVSADNITTQNKSNVNITYSLQFDNDQSNKSTVIPTLTTTEKTIDTEASESKVDIKSIISKIELVNRNTNAGKIDTTTSPTVYYTQGSVLNSGIVSPPFGGVFNQGDNHNLQTTTVNPYKYGDINIPSSVTTFFQQNVSGFQPSRPEYTNHRNRDKTLMWWPSHNPRVIQQQRPFRSQSRPFTSSVSFNGRHRYSDPLFYRDSLSQDYRNYFGSRRWNNR